MKGRIKTVFVGVLFVLAVGCTTTAPTVIPTPAPTDTSTAIRDSVTPLPEPTVGSLATQVRSQEAGTRARDRDVQSSTALRQMSIAFEGSWTVSEIRPVLEEALTLYGVPITEENYSRSGSVLVSLRKEYGPAEMAILDHMIRSYVPGVNISFPEMAGLCVTIISSERP